jgi:hypothetical protein
MINLSGFQPSTPIQIRQSLMPETVPPGSTANTLLEPGNPAADRVRAGSAPG